ncbi:kinesin-like protein KIN-14F isoform X2 [Dioscorea cayenensis subsp. rotundata]|uniref:Kinesin-like protein KIN-14F isoform X2 n=1 Tax=Dioscorea cayennensis subsp. rotundata TaxID=55577 RepID=A0AB40BV62_DIOCR|nr:kinesin-like protein KIN-14F isoform X2 [Dioscorea cayenensis subsp. rotundata]
MAEEDGRSGVGDSAGGAIRGGVLPRSAQWVDPLQCPQQSQSWIHSKVENPIITVESNDGAAQSAIQYFENMRNFLVAVAEMKLLTFEASDLEKGGSSGKVVDCILCLKGYHEWKLAGGIGIWRYGGTVKITSSINVLPSSLLDSGNGDESPDKSNSLHGQQLLERLNLFTDIAHEESKAASALSFLFNKFGLQLLQSFLTQCNGTDDLPLSSTLIDVVLEKTVEELYMLLVSQRNQLGYVLKNIMKDENRTISRQDLLDVVSRHLKENNYQATCFSTNNDYCAVGAFQNANNENKLDHQKQLEVLKLSLHELRVQFHHSKTKWEEEVKKFEHTIQGLEVSKSSYQKLLEENRLLYNQVQDLKGNIRVYCRVRPFISNQVDGKSTVDYIGENGNIMVVNPHKQGKEARRIFSFNKVFGVNASQREIFDDTQQLIRSILDGYNVCIFAYGQTGSGKTYTMSGPDIQTEGTWGVNYRALGDLFKIARSRADIITYEISVQMIEIYNEQVRDLLVTDGSSKRLDIRNNSQLNGVNIPDASLVSVNCTQDVLDLMKVGQGNRAIGATALNERSSRSHSVLTVHVHGKELVSGSILRGCLHLVDLAGSERVNKSEATGERLKEAQHINKSLSALGDVISALAQKSSHIPYRNSKLTQVLQDALGGNAKTLMFVHINPEVNAYGETISTLKFAERVASIELGAARANKETGEIKELKEEISKLKSALESKESEVVQLKDHSCRLALEVQNQRTASPLHLQKSANNVNLKDEVAQKPKSENKKIESRSCSSGKQRRPRFPHPLSEKELVSKSSFSNGDSYSNSRKTRSPSPARRSASTDRASIIKSKQRIESISERSILKPQFPEKVPTVRSAVIVPTMIKNMSLSTYWEQQEIVNEQFKPSISLPQWGIRKHRTESKGVEKHDIDVRMKAENPNKNDLSQTEDESDHADAALHGSPLFKKIHRHMRRNSQNIEPRALVHAMESVVTGKQENRLPNGDVREGKEGKNVTEPDFRRSKSLPRGKFVMIS